MEPRPSSNIADRLQRRMMSLIGAKPPRYAAVQVRPSGTLSPEKTSGVDHMTAQQQRANALARLLTNDQRSRAERILEYREMLEEVPEFARAAEVIVDFAFGSEPDGEGSGFVLDFDEGASAKTREIAQAAWTDLDLHSWARESLYEAITLGDSVTRLLFEKSGRLAGEVSIPPEQFQIHLEPNTKMIHHYRWVGRGTSQAIVMAPFEVIHYAHDARRGEFYGRPIFASGRGVRRRHEVVDDVLAMLTMRKAAGDTYWLWPFGSKATTDVVNNWINEAMNRSSMENYFDTDNNLRKRAAQSVETAPKVVPYRVLEDYPELSMKPTPVQVNPPNLDQLVNLMEHQQGRMFITTGVPKALAGSEKDVNSRATLEQQGVHFAMTIAAKQNQITEKMRAIMVRACMSQRHLPGDNEIRIKKPKVSAFDEALRATISKERSLAVKNLVEAGTSLQDALVLTGTSTAAEAARVATEINTATTEVIESQLPQ